MKIRKAEKRRCPKCGSSDLKNSMLLSGAELAIARAAMPFPFWTENNELYLCKSCGYYGPVLRIEKINKKKKKQK